MNKKGMALVLVLMVIVILTVTVTEMLYRMQVSANVSVNYKDELRAYYLAKAAFKFSMVFLKMDSGIQSQIGSQIENLNLGGISLEGIDPSTLHLWDLMPIMYPPPVSILASLVGVEVEEKEEAMLAPSESYEVEIEDESIKININALRDEKPTKDKNPLTYALLKNLFSLKEFDEIFTEEASDLRSQLVDNISDWVDKDYEARQGGDENSVYYKLEKPYKAKNNKFDSIAELMLVGDFKDKFFNEFSSYLTVYGDNKINVKAASKQVIATFFNDTVMEKQKRAEELTKLRPWDKITESNFLANMAKELGGKKADEFFLKELIKNTKNYLSTSSTKFTIKAKGVSNETEKTIVAVVDRGKGMMDEVKVFYWRVE